jgi:hypothetical protein
MPTPSYRILLLALGAVFPLTTSAYATTLLVGTTLPSTGNAFAEITVSSEQALAESFTLTTTVEITDIAVDMSGYGTDSFTLWVTNAIGPAATADNVLFQTSLTFPDTGGGLNGVAIVSTPLDLFLSPVPGFLLRAPNSHRFIRDGLEGPEFLPFLLRLAAQDPGPVVAARPTLCSRPTQRSHPEVN